MIKITKPGQKEFHGFCKWCGCEFTYEISDLKLSATSDKVSCPTCGKDYHHPSMVQDPTIPGGIGRLQTWPPEPIPCTPDMTKTDPCAGCAWRENLLRDGLYIGDTPCTWCNKGRFNVTCGDSINSLSGTSLQGASKLEQYLSPCMGDFDAQANACTTGSSECEVGSVYTLSYDQYTKPEVDKKLQEVYDAAGVKADTIAQGTVMSTILNACHDCTSNLNKCGDTEGRNSCSGEHKCNGKKNCKGKH
jgi:hypothetical protein